MKNFIIVFWFLLSFWTECFCQILPSAREIGMSNSTIADANNSFSLFFNPASLAKIASREFGIFYSPSPFGLKELANAYVVYHEPFTFLSTAIGFKTYGFKLYKENEITIGLSKNFKDKFSVGVSFSATNISIKNYGSKDLLHVSLGNNIAISPEIYFGSCIRNIYLSNYSKYLRRPLEIEAGFAYKSDNFSITSSVLKEEYYDPSFALGIEFLPVQYIALRTGLKNYPSSFSFGIGIHYSMFQIDYSAFNNSNLGLTHQFAILINFAK